PPQSVARFGILALAECPTSWRGGGNAPGFTSLSATGEHIMGTRRSDDILHANAKPRAADGALPRGLEDSLAGLEALPPTPTLPRKGGGRKDEGGEGERTRRAEALVGLRG